MSQIPTSRKRKQEDTDPDAYMGSDEEGMEDLDIRHYGRPSEKRMKRDRSGGGGLQTFTKLVCEKLEREKEMSNTDIAETLVQEHTTGDAKKNDNIRRRVYDALSVINAIGLAEKRGKTYVWAVGMEYLRQLSLSRGPGATMYSQSFEGPVAHSSPAQARTTEQRVDELGEFQLPILVLSTDCTSRMLMETDATSNEVYIKINKPYSLKSSDAVLTELGYDDINKLDAKIGNQLIRTFIAAKIPKDVIEEALSVRLSDALFTEPEEGGRERVNGRGGLIPSGFNAIMTAAQKLDSISQPSSSVRLPSVSEMTPEEPKAAAVVI
ncbi:transcription factor Dp [Blastocystis sp. ATCC 50177/Nand II]|uniref:Transcription factor Dp n=1 Tax=Blastocystis sp. subtype 1 (strain ATCC 50177 / NandII) TaxID=478820 RepID=A0A196SL05_BLAHN|nr:transcription factor Dp [Blastocystis sp. ATCC 50177/Nand II]